MNGVRQLLDGVEIISRKRRFERFTSIFCCVKMGPQADLSNAPLTSGGVPARRPLHD
jgi:hypothetical protein